MRNLLVAILALSTLVCYAQKKCGNVKYEYILPAERLLIKEATLCFNDSVSKFVFDKMDKIQNSDSKINYDGNTINLDFASRDEQGSCVFRNFINETIVVREAKTDKLFEAYLYEDIWLKIDWEIKEDSKRIGRFYCKKAVGDFRGRTYTAWFTEEIPLPYGPWKLFGLPGLILQAEDSEEMFKVTFKGINYPASCSEIDLETPSAPEVKTLKEYVEFRDNIHDYVFKKIQSRLPRHLANSIHQREKPSHGRKYHDEKVFEWEK